MNNWKYCKVKPGEKVPYPANWQNMPLTLEQIPKGDNYGLLTGPHSGILAIDFDGWWASDWWRETGLPELPSTVGWTSGKEGRAQFAFTVPEEAWPLLKTLKFGNGLPKPNLEGIEFRWTGAQSVLPPSIHPDTKEPYFWIQEGECAELPIEVIEFIYEHTKPYEVDTSKLIPINETDDKVKELVEVLEEVKNHYPTLDYENWYKVTFSCMTHIGVVQGEVVMSTFYPEQKQGEYTRLGRQYKHERHPPGIGSLIKLVRDKEPTFRKANYKQQVLQKTLDKYRSTN